MFPKFTHTPINLTLCAEIIQYNIQISYQFMRKRFDLKFKIFINVRNLRIISIVEKKLFSRISLTSNISLIEKIFSLFYAIITNKNVLIKIFHKESECKNISLQ